MKRILSLLAVVVQDGWITKLSVQRPDLDLPYRETQGQVLMPGLIDAHVHVWGDALKQSLNFGVTTPEKQALLSK